MSYEISTARDGSPTLAFKSSSAEIKIHSNYSPRKDAEKLAAAFTHSPGKIIVVCGLGLGYHVRELAKKFPDEAVIVFERDAEVLELCRQKFPETFETARVFLSRESFDSIFETMNISSFRGFSIMTNRASYSIDPAFYDAMISDANRYISSKISDLLTRFEFEERWIENMIRNSMQLKTAMRAAEFFGKFNGMPGVIVSAGPSLRKSIETLRLLAKNCVIVCVDTAYPVLCRSNITPHFVLTLDAQKHSIKHFLGTKSNGAVLIADLVSSPDILARFDGPKSVSTTSKFYTDTDGEFKREMTPFAHIIESHCGSIGDIQSGGSVATSAFDFLLSAGCSSIILIGQDLAYTGREIHSSGTHHNDSWQTMTSRFVNLDTINQNVIRKRKIKILPGVNGSTVISDYVMNLYREWFCDACGRVSIKVINALSDGAVIEGAINMKADEIIEFASMHGKNPDTVMRKIIREAKHADQSLQNYYTKALQKLQNIHDGMRSDANAIDGILEDEDLSPMLSSFTKKTMTYISRHYDITDEKKYSLIFSDIARCKIRLERTINKALKRQNDSNGFT